MPFMWMLMVIVLVAVICSAFEIIRDWKREPQLSAVVLARPRYRSAEVTSAFATSKRTAKWVSLSDCRSLLRYGDKIVFVAIRSGSQEASSPFPGAETISVSPHEVGDVLRWLPPGKIVVLCGQVELCSTMIRSAGDEHGAAPIYVLKSEPAHAKAG